MTFKETIVNFLLSEKEDTFNAGDAMEGIFALAVGLYIADGKIDKNKLNSLRKDVVIKPSKPYERILDSNIATDGYIVNKLSNITSNDKILVKVSLNLKNTAKQAFGPKALPIKNIDDSIEQMTREIQNTKVIKKVEQFVIKVLTNNKPDLVVFNVIADGVNNVNSGGELKGDVSLRVEAKTTNNIPQDIESPIHFSIKTNTSRTSNLGFFSGIIKFCNAFNCQHFIKGFEEYSHSFPPIGGSASSKILNKLEDPYLRSKINDPSHLAYYLKKYIILHDNLHRKDTDQEYKNEIYSQMKELIDNCIQHLLTTIKNEINKNDMTDDVFNFLDKEIFGKDLADVIKILPNEISEITKTDFDNLKKKYTIKVATVGNDIKFYGVDKNNNDIIVELFNIHPYMQYTERLVPPRFEIHLGDDFYKLN